MNLNVRIRRILKLELEIEFLPAKSTKLKLFFKAAATI